MNVGTLNQKMSDKLLIRWLVSVALLCLFLRLDSSGVMAEELKPFRLGCISSEDMADTQYIASIISPVLERGGYRLEIIQDSADRLNSLVTAGELEGDCGRARSHSKAFPDLIRVDPPFRHETFGIWGPASKALLPVDTLKLGRLEGWFAGSPILQELGYASLISYRSFDEMFEAVRRGEVDAFVSYNAGINQIKDRMIEANMRHHRDIVSVPIHLFLRAERAPLLPYISVAIKSRQQRDPYPEVDLGALRSGKERHIVFSCPIPSRYPLFKKIEAFYRDAFAALGYQFTMLSLPRMREMVEVLNGRLDGSCARADVKPFNDVSSLLRIRVPVAEVMRVILSTRQINASESLPAVGQLGYVRGAQMSTNALKDFPGMDLVVLNTPESGLKMLVAGRIDYMLDNNLAVDIVSERLVMDSLLYRQPYGKPIPMYPYLNRRHKDLLEAFEKQVRLQLADFPGNVIVGGS